MIDAWRYCRRRRVCSNYWLAERVCAFDIVVTPTSCSLRAASRWERSVSIRSRRVPRAQSPTAGRSPRQLASAPVMGQRLALCVLYSMTAARKSILRLFPIFRYARTKKNRPCKPQREETSLLIARVARTVSLAFWISVSCSLLSGHDEPEILRSSSRSFSLRSVDVGQALEDHA